MWKKFQRLVLLLLFTIIVFFSVKSFFNYLNMDNVPDEQRIISLMTSVGSFIFGFKGIYTHSSFIKKLFFQVASKFKRFSLSYLFNISVDQMLQSNFRELENSFLKKGYIIERSYPKNKSQYFFRLINQRSNVEYEIEIEYLDNSYRVEFSKQANFLYKLLRDEISEMNDLTVEIKQFIQRELNIVDEKYHAVFYYSGKNPYTSYVFENMKNDGYIVNLKSENNFMLTNDSAEISANSTEELNKLIKTKLVKLEY